MSDHDMVAQMLAREVDTKLARPRPLYPRYFKRAAERFRSLLALNVSRRVFLSFEYPNYIWARCTPLSAQFTIDNPRFGKWVSTSPTESALDDMARKALPYLARQELGVIKYELIPAMGCYRFLVYAREEDPIVKEVAAIISGQEPFWVSDEFCYEARGLADAVAKIYRDVKMFGLPEGVPQYDVKKALQVLDDDKKCEACGLSKIQREILRRLLTAGGAERHNPRDAYSHVIAGYFRFRPIVNADILWQCDHASLLAPAISCLFESEYARLAAVFFPEQREKFMRDYGG